jgi:hypothetical protein
MSETKASNKGIQSDAKWNLQIGQWIFSEITLLLRFYIKPEHHLSIGDKMIRLIQSNKLKNNFHLGLGGIKSYTESTTSIVAKYSTTTSHAPNGSTFQEKVISPGLGGITPKTKELTKSDIAKRVANTLPEARHKVKTEEGKRASNSPIPITSIVAQGIPDEGTTQDPMDLDTFRDDVHEVINDQSVRMSVNSVLGKNSQRLSGKSDKMLGSKGQKGKPTIELEDEEKKKGRSKGLADMQQTLRVEGRYYSPAMLLLSKNGLKKAKDDDLEQFLNKNDKNRTLTGMADFLVYFKVGGPKETVSTSTIPLVEFFIACQSGKGDGTIQAKEMLKAGVLYDHYVSKVFQTVCNLIFEHSLL